MNFTLEEVIITRSYCVMEDVIVKVFDFVFPIDFVILDMEEDLEATIILGRPLLYTYRENINLDTYDLMLQFLDKKVIFNVY